MGYFSQYALEWTERPLREDHSISSHTQQLRYYLEDLLSALEDRGVSEKALCAAGVHLWEYYDPRARYHYYEVLFVGNSSTRDLIAAAGEAAYLLHAQQSVAFEKEPLAAPVEQLKKIA